MLDGSGRLLEKNSSRDVLEKRTAGGRRILFILVSFDANLSTIRPSFKRCKRNCADHENFLTSNCRPHLKNVCPSAPWEDSSEVQNHDLCSLNFINRTGMKSIRLFQKSRRLIHLRSFQWIYKECDKQAVRSFKIPTRKMLKALHGK